VGDLFVAMESWEEADAIKASMDVILEIEAQASKNISAKKGLLELLQLLADSQVGRSVQGCVCCVRPQAAAGGSAVLRQEGLMSCWLFPLVQAPAKAAAGGTTANLTI
jgi:hypothetical protein